MLPAARQREVLWAIDVAIDRTGGYIYSRALLAGISASLAWAADNHTVFYVEKDPVTLLGLRVRKHVLGTDPLADGLVYEQDDVSFYTSVANTKDDRYVVIYAESTVSSEMFYLV